MSDTMNSEHARDRRQRFGAQRGRDLYWGFMIGFFVNAATMFMISLGGDIPELAITSAVVGVFIFVCVNSFDCMDDFKANSQDMGDEEQATNLGKKFLEAPWLMFKTLVVLIFGAMTVCQLHEMWDIF
tara:strand:+ start:137 stop:520 length:384 start_codon:yes stop_codon:yes gene_type:complete